MPPRPDGTDGSDFTYREVVQDRYKRMAVYMSATLFLFRVQAAAVLLKSLWHLVPIIVDERQPPYTAHAIVVMELVAIFFFYAGRPAKRAYLMNMKIAASCLVLMIAVLFVSFYKYHSMDPKYTHYPRKLFKYLKDQGTIESDAWASALSTLELVMDLAAIVGVGLCFYTLNTWVKDGMAIEKERMERNQAAAPAPVRAPPPGAKKKK